MNTDTGRIYEPDEYRRRLDACMSADAMRALEDEYRTAQGEFVEALAAGKIVEVTETVAQKVRLGERELARRARRRGRARRS